MDITKNHKLLEQCNCFIQDKVHLEGEVFIGFMSEVLSKGFGKVSSLATLDNANISSYANINPTFLKNVSIGTFISLAEGCKIVPRFDTEGLASTPLKNLEDLKELSPIFADFKQLDAAEPSEQSEHHKQSDTFYPHTIIGHDVWLGGNVQVRAGVVIGHGAIVGAGSYVTKHVPPYSIIVGNPARFLRYRFEQKLIDRLLESEWYQYDWRKINLPWEDPKLCVELMIDYIKSKAVPKLGKGIKIDLTNPAKHKLSAHKWTVEDKLEELYGTRDMAEFFARPEVKENSYQL